MMPSCTADGCTAVDTKLRRGLCNRHYLAWRRSDPHRVQCSIDDCSRPATAGPLCDMHYARGRVNGGRPDAPSRWHEATPLAEKMASRTVATDDACACWQWIGAVNVGGYGVVWHDGREQYAHRLAHQLHVGPIPFGYHVDHLCFNKLCVNPRHLEAVTPSVNSRRMLARRWHQTPSPLS